MPGWKRPPSYEPNQDTVTQVRRGAHPIAAFMLGALDAALGRAMSGRDGGHVFPASGLGFSITGKATGELGNVQPGVTGSVVVSRDWNQHPGFNRALPGTKPTPAVPPSPIVALLDQVNG